MTLDNIFSSEVFDGIVCTGLYQSPLQFNGQVSRWKDAASEDSERLMICRTATFREDDSRDQDTESHVSRGAWFGLRDSVRHGSEDISITGPFKE